MNAKRILVLGHAQHGKGTLCRLLKSFYDIDFMSSSEAALPHIYPSLKTVSTLWLPPSFKGIPSDITPALAHQHRGSCRRLWKELILLLNTPDRTTLSRLILSQVPVYDGMRSIDEFRASKDLFDVILWVDASKRCGVDPSMEIPYTEDMIRIDNNGPQMDLYDQVESLKHVLFQ